VEQLKYIPFSVNVVIIVYNLIFRIFTLFNMEIYSLRLFNLQYAWVLIFLMVTSFIAVLIFKRKFVLRTATMITSVLGIFLTVYFYDFFLPY
jgi:hypothetical protein